MARFAPPCGRPRSSSATAASTARSTAARRRNSSRSCAARRRSGRRSSAAPAPRSTEPLLHLHDVELDLALADVLASESRADFVDAHFARLVGHLLLLAVGV